MNARVASLALLMSLVLVSLVTGRAATVEAPLVADDLMRRAESRGSARVIVRLATAFVPEGRLASPAHVAGQRHGIAVAQGTVRGALRGLSHRVVRDFHGRLPLMAVEVGPDALRLLRSMRGTVVAVHEDRLSRPALAQSVPLIRVSPTVWKAGFDGTGQIIAILDTGVQKDHPFFAADGGKVIAEACFSTTFLPDHATSLCPGGLEESFVEGAAQACPTDVAGCEHGTHVSGIAAGDGRGVAGAPPGGVARGAKIIAIQVFSRLDNFDLCFPDFTCALSQDSDQIAALDWLHSQRLAFSGLRIAAANMSLGGGVADAPCPGDILEPAIAQLRTRMPAMRPIPASRRSSPPAMTASPTPSPFPPAIRRRSPSVPPRRAGRCPASRTSARRASSRTCCSPPAATAPSRAASCRPFHRNLALACSARSPGRRCRRHTSQERWRCCARPVRASRWAPC
jgi:hypothetical protein